MSYHNILDCIVLYGIVRALLLAGAGRELRGVPINTTTTTNDDNNNDNNNTNHNNNSDM